MGTAARVTPVYDPVTEQRTGSVRVELDGRLEEFLEQMYLASYGVVLAFETHHQRDTTAEQKCKEAVAHASTVMLANGDVAREMSEVIHALHCEVHHPGQTCDEAKCGDKNGERAREKGEYEAPL